MESMNMIHKALNETQEICKWYFVWKCLTFTTLWTNSSDDKFIPFLFFTGNILWNFMQIVSVGDNLHETQSIFSGEKKIKMSSAENFTQQAKH